MAAVWTGNTGHKEDERLVHSDNTYDQYYHISGLIKKDGGGGLSTLSCSSSMESLLSSAEQSPAGSASGSPISSPVTARRNIRESVEPSQSLHSPSIATVRTTKLNLLEERLKEEFSGSSRMLM